MFSSMRRYEVISAWVALFLLKRVDGYTLKTPLSSWKHCPALMTESTPAFISRENTILKLTKDEQDQRINDIQARKKEIDGALDVFESQMKSATLEWKKAKQPILDEMMKEWEDLEEEESYILRNKGVSIELMDDIQKRKQDIEAALDLFESQMESASLEWIKEQQPILNEMVMEFESLEEKEREILRNNEQL